MAVPSIDPVSIRAFECCMSMPQARVDRLKEAKRELNKKRAELSQTISFERHAMLQKFDEVITPLHRPVITLSILVITGQHFSHLRPRTDGVHTPLS